MAVPYMAASHWMSSVREGNADYQSTKMLFAERGASMFGRGQDVTGGMARDLSSDFRRQARSLGTDTGTVQEISRFLDDQGYFKTVSSTAEFKEKFGKALSTIKDIAKQMQSTIEDATQTFSQIRQQGFYQSADVGAQALRQGALAGATGRDPTQVAAMGAYGAQVARQYGMKGRFGAEVAQTTQAAVDIALRNKAISEEMVMENGGAEAVAARLTQVKLGFTQTSRGRMMMANSMNGSGYGMDPDRLGSVLSGDKSLAGLARGGFGRGMGVLDRAGSAEAQQEFAQYSGMAMVMSAIKERQAQGLSTDKEGILMGLRRNPGVGRDEAQLLLGETLSMGRTMAAQREQEQFLKQQSEFDTLSSRYSLVAKTKGWVSRNIGEPGARVGARVGEEADQLAQAFGEFSSGRREMRSGGTSRTYLEEGMAADRRGGGESRNVGGFADVGDDPWLSPFAVPGARARFREEYSEYAAKGLRGDVITAARRGATFDPGGGYSTRGGKVYDREGNAYADAGSATWIREGAVGLDSRYREGTARHDLTEESVSKFKSMSDMGLMGNIAGEHAMSRDESTWTLMRNLDKSDPLLKAGKGMTLAEYRAMSPEHKAGFEGAISRGLDAGAGADSEIAKAYRGQLGPQPSGNFTTSTSSAEQHRADLNALLTHSGPNAGLLYGNYADELVSALDSNDKATEIWHDATTMALEGAEFAGSETKFAGFKKKLEAAGLSGQALEQAMSELGHLKTSSGDARSQLRGLASKGRSSGAWTAYRRSQDVGKQITNDAFEQMVRGPEKGNFISRHFGAYADEARGLQKAAGGQGSYEDAWEALVQKMGSSGKGLDIELLDLASGGQAGARALGTELNSVLNKKTRAGALKGFGYDDAAVASFTGMSDRDLMAKLVKDKTLTPEMFGGGTETKRGAPQQGAMSVEGMEATAWNKQREFVIAVDRFLNSPAGGGGGGGGLFAGLVEGAENLAQSIP
jgi:hypothetical protein